jgi:hypothetical protein
MTDCGCKRATIRQSSKALGRITNFRAGLHALSPRACKQEVFPYLIGKYDYFLLLLWPVVGNLISEFYQPPLNESGSGNWKEKQCAIPNDST